MLIRIIGGHGGISPGFKATSYLIDGKLLIDAGSVASGLLIEEQNLIENILISHPHLDHIKDLAFISDNCFGMRSNPFEVYSNATVKDAVLTHLMNDMIWPDFSKLPTKDNPTIRFNEISPEKELTLGDYKILPVRVNHPGDAMGFIITKGSTSILFTQDTGPTERIWEVAKSFKNLKAIFTEVSFPNKLTQVAIDSYHMTPKMMKDELHKMPEDVPIFLGHMKPNFQTELFVEIDKLHCDRLNILTTDATYVI